MTDDIRKDPFPEMVLYRVLRATMSLPGTGQCSAWAVCQVLGVGKKDSPAVAVLLSKQHAEQYAEFLMRERIQVLGVQR